ncbi:hypothetical protein HNY73_002586 [Argiope bruennichi]|uniref:Uncharacterized protein n=1 Tax=Argiope bruennichi TaxID=94029 RepID=A0A8T0FU49_ARGBR|nr:hypothetical protein HNY73_002586 [Argiope bruennichi]
MKRQSVGIRRGSGESRSQINETKRLKVAHSHEDNFQNNELEAGSGSDSTEEYININGQDKNLKYSMMVEENSPAQKFSEINHESLLHASVSTTEESSTAGYHVNGKYSEENEMPVLMPEDTSNKTFANGSEEIADEENFSVISHSNIVASSNISKLPENTAAETNGMLQENVLSPITNKQTKTQINADKSEFNCPATENMEQQNYDQKGSCSSSYQESDIQSIDEKVATMSKVSFDVENITLCQLQVTLLEGHADVVFGVDADEDFVLSSSGDTTVKVWNVEDKKEISNFAGHNAAVTSVILLSSEESETLRSKLNCFQTSRIAVSASYDCHIRLWSVLDGMKFYPVSLTYFCAWIYLKEHNYVVVGTGFCFLGGFGGFPLGKNPLKFPFGSAHDSSVSSLKIHDCYVYSSSKDGKTVKVWLFDEEELQPLYTRRRGNIPHINFSYTGGNGTVHNDVLFLGDNTSCLKTLDWRIGRLRLHLNQPDACGVCEAVLVKDNILLFFFFLMLDENPGGAKNVWKLPEMIYVGTLTGDLQEICSLALVRSKQKLRIVSGGHQLVVWDFDFSKPPQKGLQDPFFVCEADKIGSEVNEVEMLSPTKAVATPKEENTANKKSWCNIS